jgi:hypothetical protein
VDLPPARGGGTNPVDRLLSPYFTQAGWSPPRPVSDRVFARRVYLDVIGLLPTPEELRAFERDRRLDKRARLVRRLLADNTRFAAHWLTFWNDCLRNDYQGTGYIDGGRKQITPWLYSALATNLAYDRFVARLIAPDQHAEGFTKGIVWRGAVNASQTPAMQAAQNISQVFLGINLKCASCHDSFISHWKLADAYGLATIYAEEPLELVRCDKPTGEMAARRFLFPQLGAVAETTNKAERLQSLATVITSRQDGRLTRTIVNRLWARFLGRGLVEPVDEMDNAPWNADLLDWLAEDLADHDYDLKRTMERILTSQVYAWPAVPGEERISDRFVFRGPVVKRLTAEEYLDALSELTGVWFPLPASAQIDFTAGNPGVCDPPPSARWVWSSTAAREGVPPGTTYFRGEVFCPTELREALLVVTADNRFTLYVNGREAGSGDDWKKPHVFDVREHLTRGRNVIAVAVTNDEVKEGDKSPNPAGLILAARMRPAGKSGAPGWTVRDFVSSRDWLCATNQTDGWEKPEFKADGWQAVTELGGPDTKPWELEPTLRAAWSCAAQFGRVRAGFVVADPLTSALGRPNREQVATVRPATATTMQALEIMNGATLAALLKRSVAVSLAGNSISPSERVTRLFVQALGRPPTTAERRLAAELLGRPVCAGGVEDLLWAITNLPEFQLIY